LASGVVGFVRTMDQFQEDLDALLRGQAAAVLERGLIGGFS
jgi:hypothetical protein